ncbi:MAG: hypothetical protein LBH44_14250 [Treponema sp.]|nr:hypothetical protein [Treponema sp.]
MSSEQVAVSKRIIFFSLILYTANLGLFAQGLTFSGLLDSSVSLRAGAVDSPAFSYGVEEFANIRMQAKLKDSATFYGAFNFIAAAGDYAAAVEQMGGFILSTQPHTGVSPTSYADGVNYIAAMELERLYFRLNGESVDLDGGLMRLPFGYGQIWGSSDFLNPKNPLKPDARPRAVLGAGLSWYPNDDLKLLGFGAAPRNPFEQSGEGGLTGISMERHWDKASLQALYSFESPAYGSDQGIHRAGISVKADLEVGLVMDALYVYNHEAWTEIDGLSFSLGADYSFLDGNLIVLAEYLYNGVSSSTAAGFSNENYLYTGFTWRFNDYTNVTIALISCFDDVSFTPVVSLNHDLFQGATLTVTAQAPLDRDLFSGDGNRGELGPIPPDRLQPLLPERFGHYFDLSAKLRLRF